MSSNDSNNEMLSNSDDVSQIENLVPIPMRRQPSSMGEILRPSLFEGEQLNQEEEAITAPNEVPHQPLMLRR